MYMKGLRMNRRLAAMGVLSVAVALLMGACGTAPTPSPTPTAAAAPEAEAGSVSDKPAWLVEWEETVEKAKAEGEVVITGGSAAVEYRPIFDIFEQKFGITVKSSGGSSREVVDRILAELAAGRKPGVDIMLSGGRTIGTRLVPNNALAPMVEALILPEVADPSNWYGGHHWFTTTDREGKYGFTYAARVDTTVISGWYNEEQIPSEDLRSIESVWDLVDPRFAGKIVGTDPDFTDSGWVTAWFHPEIGEEWYHRYFAPEFGVTFMSDPRLIADQLALGKFGMCFPCANVGTQLRALQSLGAPIVDFKEEKHFRFKEKQFLSTGGSRANVGLIGRAPHANAAKVFLNWFFSKEGQTAMHVFTIGTPNPTLRVDVTEMGLTVPAERRRPGVEYVELARLIPNFVDVGAEAMDNIRTIYYESIGR